MPLDRVQRGRVAAAAAELAVRLAAGPTAAYAAIKESLRYAWTATLPEALDKEAALQARVGATEDHLLATNAFLKRERPTFTGH